MLFTTYWDGSWRAVVRSQASRGFILSSSFPLMCKCVHLCFQEQSLIGPFVQPASYNPLRYPWAPILSGKPCFSFSEQSLVVAKDLLGMRTETGVICDWSQSIWKITQNIRASNCVLWSSWVVLIPSHTLQYLKIGMDQKQSQVLCLALNFSSATVSLLSDLSCTHWQIKYPKVSLTCSVTFNLFSIHYGISFITWHSGLT